MKKLLLLVVFAALGYAAFARHDAVVEPPAQAGATVDAVADASPDARASGTQIRGAGIVSRILPDDEDGSRHQRFILRLPSGQTLLVAHNIDLAPRIDGLKPGDTVAYYGQYEWNAKGGVVHWTHRDPSGRHVAGWLKHDGRIYQ